MFALNSRSASIMLPSSTLSSLLRCDESHLEIRDWRGHFLVPMRRSGWDEDDVSLLDSVRFATLNGGAVDAAGAANDRAACDDNARAFDDVVQFGVALVCQRACCLLTVHDIDAVLVGVGDG